jgi:dipeptidyl-peptidase-4
LLFADRTSGKTRTILTEEDSCWIDVFDDLTFLKNDRQFIWSSERDGFKHLYLYNLDGKLTRQLTKGPWEVEKLEAVDEAEGIIYFSSSERGTMYRDIYSINLDGSHHPSFSPSASYCTDTYSNITMPPSISLYSSKAGKIADLTAADLSYNNVYALGKPEFFSFKTSDGVALSACMIKPPDFDSTKKYPVLFYNYSGPGSQIVKDEFGGGNYFWHQMLAENGYIIFMVDNRGTGGRGTAFKHLAYKKLGTWEPNDLIEGAKFMAAQPYVDASRIGIWGWSYGGYMTALTLLKGADYFKIGVAVAPVTSWRFYDDIYTERYMSLPSLNEEGYENSAVLTYTQKLKGKLLLVHGTADDNVHFQNSVKLADKLISENKQFTTMFYPEKTHGIYGGKTRQHLFTMITNFILQNL